MRIGVFDSGCGGLITLEKLRVIMPEAEFYYIGDREHHPYGSKTPEELVKITTVVVEKLEKWGAQLVVIACNTATTNCIGALRQRFPGIIFVGTEPAIKMAYDAGCERVVALMTEGSAKSKQVARLRESAERQAEVDGRSWRLTVVPCPGLAEVIERGVKIANEFVLEAGTSWELPRLGETELTEIGESLGYLDELEGVRSIGGAEGVVDVDGVVLGCTHYGFVSEVIQQKFPHAKIFDGAEGVARQTRRLAETL